MWLVYCLMMDRLIASSRLTHVFIALNAFLDRVPHSLERGRERQKDSFYFITLVSGFE